MGAECSIVVGIVDEDTLLYKHYNLVLLDHIKRIIRQ